MIKITGQDKDKGTITLQQDMFLLDKNDTDKAQIWSIPIKVVSSSGSELYNGILDGKEKTFQLGKENDGEKQVWINVNPSQVGFYRVQYPKEMIQSFLPAM